MTLPSPQVIQLHDYFVCCPSDILGETFLPEPLPHWARPDWWLSKSVDSCVIPDTACSDHSCVLFSGNVYGYLLSLVRQHLHGFPTHLAQQSGNPFLTVILSLGDFFPFSCFFGNTCSPICSVLSFSGILGQKMGFLFLLYFLLYYVSLYHFAYIFIFLSFSLYHFICNPIVKLFIDLSFSLSSHLAYECKPFE